MFSIFPSPFHVFLWNIIFFSIFVVFLDCRVFEMNAWISLMYLARIALKQINSCVDLWWDMVVWCFVFEIYKKGLLACSHKSIPRDDFVHSNTKQYGLNFFRLFYDMDEIELHLIDDKIIEGFDYISTTIDINVNVETLLHYCKRTKYERTTKNLISEFLKVRDNGFYASH